jgi:hypothetical protein
MGVEMEGGMKGDNGGLIWCPYLPKRNYKSLRTSSFYKKRSRSLKKEV